MAEQQFSSLYLDDSAFGIDILLIREINRNLELTPVDQAPEFVRGLMNLRGQIVTVLDLGVRLGLGPRTITDESRCVVLKTNEELSLNSELQTETCDDVVGLLVDRVGDMINVDSKDVEPPPANISGVDGKFLSGVIQLDQQLLVTLKTSEILTQDK